MISLIAFTAGRPNQERLRAPLIIAHCIFAITVLTSCAVLPGFPQDAAERSKVSDPTESGISPQSPSATNSASEIRAKMETTLSSLTSDIHTLDRTTFRDAIARLDPAIANTVEVSIFTTPTGLDVEAVQGAIQIDGTCVFGELRDTNVTTTLLPVLPNGRCFIGDQR